MSTGKCRGCGKEIIWIRTASGKSMPCDPEEVVYWAKDKAPGKVITPSGEVVSCTFEGDISQATGMGYVSHFASCPSAKKFRRQRDG